MTSPLDEKGLMPCPCGGAGVERWPDSSTRHYVVCLKCGRRTSMHIASHGGSAREEWNGAILSGGLNAPS
jgi:hypothetical protein